MPDVPVTLTQRRLTRDKLSRALGGDPDVVKAFENLTTDVTQTLPEAIGATTSDSSSMLAAVVFVPRATPPQYTDPAADILAAQIFGG